MQVKKFVSRMGTYVHSIEKTLHAHGVLCLPEFACSLTYRLCNEYLWAGILVITIFMVTHSSEGKRRQGKRGPATALELGTYALSRSFSHASHGDRSRSFVPHRPYVPVTGVPLS